MVGGVGGPLVLGAEHASPQGSLIHCLLSQASLPGNRNVQSRERGRLQGSLRPWIWNTHSITLLCSSGENKSQSQPDSRGGE